MACLFLPMGVIPIGLWLLGDELLVGSEPVESLSVDARAGALRHEGVGVNLVDEVEDEVALRLLGNAEHHLEFLSRVETVAVEGGAATLGILVDGLANVAPLTADDEELHAHVHAVDDVVDEEGEDEEQHVAIEYLFPVVEHQIG